MKRTQKEYGGYLPLELAKGGEYFQYENKQMRRFNCAKAAISYLLEHMNTRLIYMPYYMCPNVCMEVERHSIEVKYYHIDEQMLPIGIEDREDVFLYLTNYFGVMDEKITQYVNGISSAKVIIDNCHSFFHQPIFSKNVFNIYSCKKFFGVPDGAYLVAECLEQDEEEEEEEVSYSSEHALYLMHSLERGTNYCYSEKKQADVWLASKYCGMSILGRKMLESIRYDEVKNRRMSNFALYQKAFGKINIIHCEEKSIPYIYPLNVGKDIKKKLVEKKIYVPTLWGTTLEKEFEGTFEYYLSKNTIFLPLDQRYVKDDITYIIDVVKGILKDE